MKLRKPMVKPWILKLLKRQRKNLVQSPKLLKMELLHQLLKKLQKRWVPNPKPWLNLQKKKAMKLPLRLPKQPLLPKKPRKITLQKEFVDSFSSLENVNEKRVRVLWSIQVEKKLGNSVMSRMNQLETPKMEKNLKRKRKLKIWNFLKKMVMKMEKKSLKMWICRFLMMRKHLKSKYQSTVHLKCGYPK